MYKACTIVFIFLVFDFPQSSIDSLKNSDYFFFLSFQVRIKKKIYESDRGKEGLSPQHDLSQTERRTDIDEYLYYFPRQGMKPT